MEFTHNYIGLRTLKVLTEDQQKQLDEYSRLEQVNAQSEKELGIYSNPELRDAAFGEALERLDHFMRGLMFAVNKAVPDSPELKAMKWPGFVDLHVEDFTDALIKKLGIDQAEEYDHLKKVRQNRKAFQKANNGNTWWDTLTGG